MMMATAKQQLTVNDVADRFGKNPSRIRQLCIEHGIGKLIAGRVRLLTEADAKKLGRFFAEKGHLSKNSKNLAQVG